MKEYLDLIGIGSVTNLNSTRLSIITINFNNKNGLQKTIESVVNQTYANYEYIIIDGGSTDGSKEIIEKYSDKLTFWVSEKDNGVYHAMNKGIKRAKGQYCFFLNSGDWLASEDIFEKVTTLNMDRDIVYGNLLKVYTGAKVVIDKGMQRSKLTLYDIAFGTIHHQTAFITRVLFEKYGLYNETYKIVSDWAFFVKTIGIQGVTVKYIDLNISYYDMHGMSSNSIERDGERAIELKRILPATIYPDYQEMWELKYKANFLERIKRQKLLWFLIRVHYKLFGLR